LIRRPGRPGLKAQLEVALRQLGLDPKTAILDHTPPLALRERTPEGGYIPDADDPAHMQWLGPEANRKKTIGTPATTAGSDIANIAKVRRILLARDPEAEKLPKRRWPQGRKLQSRPFPTRRKL
jgi:hypothetical protein